jgi:mannose/fructose-specific phosphotransferase system component IIA
VTGINLPLIVRLACATGAPTSLHALAQWAVEKAQGGVRLIDLPRVVGGASHG